MGLATSSKVLIGFLAFLLLVAYGMHLLDKGYRDYNPLPKASVASSGPPNNAGAFVPDEDFEPDTLPAQKKPGGIVWDAEIDAGWRSRATKVDPRLELERLRTKESLTDQEMERLEALEKLAAPKRGVPLPKGAVFESDSDKQR